MRPPAEPDPDIELPAMKENWTISKIVWVNSVKTSCSGRNEESTHRFLLSGKRCNHLPPFLAHARVWLLGFHNL